MIFAVYYMYVMFKLIKRERESNEFHITLVTKSMTSQLKVCF